MLAYHPGTEMGFSIGRGESSAVVLSILSVMTTLHRHRSPPEMKVEFSCNTIHRRHSSSHCLFLTLRKKKYFAWFREASPRTYGLLNRQLSTKLSICDTNLGALTNPFVFPMSKNLIH
ncbi:hypothetical protein Nepgr_003134 [Nepenthes gracilis]|uniref:Uncharacterized protein n=1 Tax=Nepenthes gracilis TaxID=150966 RepID=A0AAD3RYY1_NEPGR|nr:hypothetical protein Nepgr_003134 [Nepenthes gracilis]